METSQVTAEVAESKPALVFDADSITLTGTFSDELSTYRARKQWGDALSKYFLIEKNRDFEMKISKFEDEGIYTLKCNFSSACGRYAFWRLVNHQAPEVEATLHSSDLMNKKTARFLLGSVWNATPQSSWSNSIESSLEAVDSDVKETTSVIVSLLKYFKGTKSPR